MSQDTDHGWLLDRELASRLFGLEGVEVIDIDTEADGSETVWVRTCDPQAMVCPGCGTASPVKEQVTTAPADVETGGRRVRLVQARASSTR